MCGVAGVSNGGLNKEKIAKMLDLTVHRGPDEQLMEYGDGWAVGVNRLSITSPLESKTQPLWCPKKKHIFVFNGQVYNFLELRGQLERVGYQFRTQSDAEVLLYSYLNWGTEAFLKAQGMFAGAIWNQETHEWTLFRDPVGVKPLYYCCVNSSFYFSSEIRSLLRYFPSKLNESALTHYLRYRYVPGEETLFQGVYRALPGCTMRFSATGMELRRDPYISFSTENSKQDICDEEFADILARSIQMTEKTEVPKGTLISGGLDSSLLSQEVIRQDKKCDSFFFDNGYDCEELKSLDFMEKKLKINVERVYASSKDFQLLPKVIEALEEPLGDSVILPTYLLLRAAGKSNKVIVSGEGADEIFAGYAHHFAFDRLKKIKTFIPENLIKKMVERVPVVLLNQVFPYPGQLTSGQLQKILQIVDKKPGSFDSGLQLFSDAEIESLVNAPDWSGENLRKKSIDSLRDLMNLDIQTWLPNYNLLRMDKLGMHFSLEVRVPYLNSEVIQASMNLKNSELISFWGKRKQKLSRIAESQFSLPARIANRKKHPFTFKEKHVDSAKYRDFINDYLNESFAQSMGLNSSFINTLKKKTDFISQKQITSLLNLAIWKQVFF